MSGQLPTGLEMSCMLMLFLYPSFNLNHVALESQLSKKTHLLLLIIAKKIPSSQGM